MARLRWLLAALAVLALAGVAMGAMYEDQAGLFDWTRHGLGRIQATHTRASMGDKQLWVASEANVAASLRAADGEMGGGGVVWRQVLPEHEAMQASALGEEALVTVSYRPEPAAFYVRAWSAERGRLQWEATVPASPNDGALGASATIIPRSEDPAGWVLVRAGRTILAVSMGSGRAVWRVQPFAGALDAVWTSLVEDRVYVVGLDTADEGTAHRVHAATVRLADGDTVLASDENGHDAAPTTAADALGTVLVGTTVVTLENRGDGQAVWTWDLADPAAKFVRHDLKLAFPADKAPRGRLQAAPSTAAPVVLLVLDNPSAVVALQNALYLAALDLTACSGEGAPRHTTATAAPLPGGAHGRLVRADRLPASAAGDHALVVFEDGYTASLAGGQVAWAREEGLSEVVAVDIVDLPKRSLLLEGGDVEDTLLQYEQTNLISGLGFRLTRHWQLLNTVLASLVTGRPAIQASSASDEIAQDHLGTRKVLLMVSAHSRVYGMASWTGEVLWARTIVGARDVRYHQVRHATSHDPVGVLTYVDAATGTVAVVAIDPVTGRELPDAVPRNALGALRPEWVYAVTPATPTEGYGVLFVATDGQAVLVPVRLPGGHEATAPTARLPAPLYFFHTTSGPSPAIECVRVHQAADGAVVGTRAWRIPLAPGEEVVAQAHRTPGEHVATIGRVLGNRSVLYKYLNPHLYAVATLRVGLLRVRIVDGVTGVLLHESVQKDVEGPVTLVACEHWVVYSYVDAASQVTEMVVIELYESHEPNKRDERPIFTSYNGTIPSVLSQAYALPAQPVALAVTQTRHGITSRQVLAGLATDQLYGINKKLLDPRRHSNTPTAEDAEEGLIKYAPALVIEPRHILSYNQTVARIRSITTAPAQLESLSLVVVTGLDLFFTRVSPSQTFDSLSDEFNYAALVLTLVALATATVVTGRWARAASLRTRWR